MRRGARSRFWLVWAVRDARRRWLQVLTIALLIALGTGMYSSMSSMSRWRVASADGSFAKLRMHDLRVSLAEATYAPEGSLRAAARGLGPGARIADAEERLVVPTQVDASVGGRTIMVPGRVVGAAVDPAVDRLFVTDGRALAKADSGRPRVALERSFADFYDLRPSGRLRLAGGTRVSYVGQVLAPEYFIVTAPGADFGAESSFAVMFTSLRTAQALAGGEKRVNELVVRAPGADVEQLRTALATALRKALPGVGFTFTRADEEPAHRLIYNDAENDQQMLDIFALLLLGAAAFAAFNLVSRAVEAQRREIGIGMALGVRPARLAVRPLLLGVQIALLGVAFGVPIGLLSNAWLGNILRTWFPLPVLETPFEPGVFLTGAALGLALPLAATALPVWRAVRVAPVEAIRVGARAGGSSGLAWLAKGLRLPGGSLANMPVRNVLRTPRRTVLTGFGIAAVVTIVFSMSAMMDSFDATLGAARDEALAGSADRLTVDLAAPATADSPVVRAVQRAQSVGATQTSLRLPVTVSGGGRRFGAFVEVVGASGRLWKPTLRRGSLSAGEGGGVALAGIAAEDLGAGVGERVRIRHPLPGPDGGFTLATQSVTVTGIHTSPFRFVVYADATAAARMGLTGLVNRVSVVPAAGRDGDAVKRELLGIAGVSAVQGANAVTDAVDDRMEEFNEIILGVVLIGLAMALLMAYNASAINADERAREHATMFAFGVVVRRVLQLGVAEAFLIGLFATVLGGAAGFALLQRLVGTSWRETMPDIGVLVAVKPLTVAFAIVAGTVAVALAPLLTRRRLRRTDISTTLRVVE